MFTLMIVEDEVRLQYNLAYNIPWEEYDIELVGTAGSGEEALPLVQLRKPDLLLVDIEMPGMDGLQLMEAVLQREESTRFIVLSGHDNFEYAQSALRNGADNYLLKPAGNPEILAAVLESVRRIKVEREGRYNLEQLQRRWREHLPALQQRFLQQWVKGKYTEQEIDRSAEELQLHPLAGADRLFVIAILDIDPRPIPDTAAEEQGQEIDRKWQQFSVHAMTEEYLAGADCLVFEDDNGSTTVVIRGETGEEGEALLYRANIAVVKLLEAVNDCLHVSVSAGLGNPAVRSEALVSYRQALSALQERVVYGSNLVIPYNPGKPSETEMRLPDTELERRLQLAMEAGDGARARQLVHQWYEESCDPAPTVQLLQEQLLFMQSLLVRTIHAKGWSVQEVAGDELAIFKRPDEFVSKELIVPWVERAIDSYFAYSERQQTSKRHHFIDGLLDIVEQTLDQNIGLHEIADKLYVHPSYLSRLFKKETGKKFSAYLYERKMQRAKELLQEGARVYEASQRIGYRDISYFTKLFRKYWGVMPSEISRER